MLKPEQVQAVSRANEAFRLLCAARKPVLRASDLAGEATWALESFVQLNLHRTTALAAGMSAEWNKRRLVNCVVLGRSLMENVAAMWCVLDDADQLLARDDIRGIHSRAVKAMFGRRNQKGDDFPIAVNVLTLFDRLEKAYPGVRSAYESTCEFVHPNCDALSIFREASQHDREFDLAPADAANDPWLVQHAMLGLAFLGTARMCHQQYLNAFRPRVEELDRRFGPFMDRWAGGPGHT